MNKHLPKRLIPLLFLVPMNLKAQQPVMKVTSTDSTSVTLTKLKTTVKVIGNYAVTTMEMEFYNSTDFVLEGDLSFPMPEGVSVSRFAIDIDGKMREAVPIEKERGQIVFENIERRKVDPGLLEKVEGNNFHTRIYPIPQNGCRRVIIGYEQLVPAKGDYSFVYSLPLHFKQPLKDFDFSITVASNFIPEVGSDCNTHLKFEELNKVFTSSVSEKNYTPDGSFTIVIPKTPDAAEVSMQHVFGQYYFLINILPSRKTIERKIPDVITVIWDASLSGLKRDHKKELDLLDAYIRTKSQLTIHLYQLALDFKKINTYNISGGNWHEMRKRLENIIYDGATNFSAIAYLPPGEEYLVFTDGLNTFGNIDDMVLPQKPVYSICAAPTADYSLLNFVASKTGGAFINLNELDINAAQKYLTAQTLRFLGIKPNSNITESYPSMATPVGNNFSIVGISHLANVTVTLQFGYGTTVAFEQLVDMNFDLQKTNFVDIEKIWAQKKIADLDIQYDRNKEAITELGKRYSIVTRNTSLIVLDRVEDYVRYEIEPPTELQEDYSRLMSEKQLNIVTKQKDALAEALKYFIDVKAWWKKRFRKVYRSHKYKRLSTENFITFSTQALASTATTYTWNANNASSFAKSDSSRYYFSSPSTSQGFISNGTASTLTLSGRPTETYDALSEDTRPRIANNLSPFVTADITINETTPDKSYIRELKKVGSGNRYKRYIELRKGDQLPGFYFNVANLFFKNRDTATGYKILSNIAELNLSDHESYKMLGYRLKTIKKYDDALMAFRKVMELRPQDPQSYRDYALALEDVGKYQEALDTLYLALTRDYDEQIKNLYPGIEEIIVTEINELIALHGEGLNISKIGKSLIKKMPVDVRVVLNWNMNETDIDLWVIDPNGEKCFYGHKLTSIGGRISNDFTQGYGPEHFMLKRALKGKYKVMINYFGDRQQKIAGPTTVMAEIFTNYGRPTQQRKMITLQMQKTENAEVLVGEFSF